MSLDRRPFLTRSLGGAAVAGASLAAVDAQALTLARPDRVASRMRSEVTSRSNWANDNSTFKVSRPITSAGCLNYPCRTPP